MRLRAAGRGRHYPPWRGLMESVLGVAYRGDWPARLWGRLPRASAVSVVRHRLALPPGPGSPGRVAFVSDLHIGPTTPVPLLERAFSVIRDASVDALLLGGDYVSMEATPARLDLLGRLVSSVACRTKIAVLGNHDLWADDRAIVDVLTGAGAAVLVNQARPLPEPWSDVVVLGLDDPMTGQCDAAAAQAHVNGQPVRIVVCHTPDGLQHVGDVPFDLYLCGHTHGGHLATPWGPLVLPPGALCRRYAAGFARAHGRDVFVSRGLGGVEVPIRTWAPPDVLLIDLVRG